jgi:hypothetical protein
MVRELPLSAEILYHELGDLGQLLLAELERDDESGLETFTRRRAEILDALGSDRVVPPGPDAAAAIHHVLALDQMLIAQLEARKRVVHDAVEALRLHRASLERFRGPSPASSVYVDRLG